MPPSQQGNLYVDDAVSSSCRLMMMHVQVEIRSSTQSLNLIASSLGFRLRHHECTISDCIINVQREIQIA